MMDTLALLGGTPVVPPLNREVPVLTEATVEALHRAADRARYDWSYLSGIAGGGPIEELERGFAGSVRVKHALALSSCTAALFTALLACGVRLGDEVIVPTYTWGQSAAPILHVGATPIFADIDPQSYTLAIDSLERLITERTRAVIVVHLFGHPAEMPAIAALCRASGLRLIEDAAHSLGAAINGKSVGAWGDASCFSLGRGKPVTGGEGGVLCTNRTEIFERAVSLTQHPIRQNYELSGRLRRQIGEFGYNLRIHPLAAVIATSELEHYEAERRRRAVFYSRLADALQDVPGIRQASCPPGYRHAYYRYCPTYVQEELGDGTVPREVYVAALAAEGVPIDNDPIRIPLHRRPTGALGKRGASGNRYAVSETRCQRTGLAFASSLATSPREDTPYLIRCAFLKVASQSRALCEVDL